jgi:hypothetical protein
MKSLTKEEFITRARRVCGMKYNYPDVFYVNKYGNTEQVLSNLTEEESVYV